MGGNWMVRSPWPQSPVNALGPNGKERARSLFLHCEAPVIISPEQACWGTACSVGFFSWVARSWLSPLQAVKSTPATR